ncbi:MAG: CinA family nicotinamide mononucleotide deamidase-related protein [Planctomycetota bacterium]
MKPQVAVVTVGDELLTGDIVDRHSAWLSHALTTHGYAVEIHMSAGDAPGALRRSLAAIPGTPQVVLIVGGLGPTADDRTRSEVAAAVGVETEFRDGAWRNIEDFFRRLGREPVARNRSQAYFPVGSEVVDNRFGTAPGIRLKGTHDADWWVLPGVPHELHGLFRETVLPALLRDCPPPREQPMTEFRFFAVPESELDGWLLQQIPATQHEGIHLCCGDGELRVRLDEPLDLAPAAQKHYGTRFLGAGGTALEERVVQAAVAAGCTIATAESCTGGLLGTRLTDVVGASQAYAGGWVVYSNELKTSQLGVEAAVIAECGAVSAEVARALAAGARERAAAGIGIGITGVAGPGGATAGKPVGTVHLGLAFQDQVCSTLLRLRGERDRVRSLAANHALFAALRTLRGDRLATWSRDQSRG